MHFTHYKNEYELLCEIIDTEVHRKVPSLLHEDDPVIKKRESKRKITNLEMKAPEQELKTCSKETSSC